MRRRILPGLRNFWRELKPNTLIWPAGSFALLCGTECPPSVPRVLSNPILIPTDFSAGCRRLLSVKDLPGCGFSDRISSVKFELVGAIEHVETIAAGPSVKVRSFLHKTYGRGRCRKRKGVATVRSRMET